RLSDSSHDVDRQLVRFRHIRRHEASAAVLELGEKGEVAAEPVQLCNDQGRAGELASGERLFELRAIVVLAGLDFDKLRQQLPRTAVEEISHGFALRVQAEAAPALPRSADTIVGNEISLAHTV